MAKAKTTRVGDIIAAQRDVSDWLQTLSVMSADDPRFDDCLKGFENAIAARNDLEADYLVKGALRR